MYSETVQSNVKTFLPGSEIGWLKYCDIVQFWDVQWNILRVILKTESDVFTQLCTFIYYHIFVGYRCYRYNVTVKIDSSVAQQNHNP